MALALQLAGVALAARAPLAWPPRRRCAHCLQRDIELSRAYLTPRRQRHRRRPTTAAAAAEASTAPPTQSTREKEQMYEALDMYRWSFLIPVDGVGRLDVRRALRYRPLQGDPPQRAVPAPFQGQMAAGPRVYLPFPCAGVEESEALSLEPSRAALVLLYLVGVDSIHPLSLDLQDVVRFDGVTGLVTQCDVLRVAPEETPVEDLWLRIRHRDGKLILDAKENLPEKEEAVQEDLKRTVFYSPYERETGLDVIPPCLDVSEADPVPPFPDWIMEGKHPALPNLASDRALETQEDDLGELRDLGGEADDAWETEGPENDL